MEKYRAIPPGYMTVGEIAKKMGVTVRTLQYYDNEGLFSPSKESEGGRRLYTDKDFIKLYQIISLKHLGFSVRDIKNRMISLDKPTDVARMLTEQAADMKSKIQSLTQAHEEIELLTAEVLQMQSVDFKKYADIITNLQIKNEFYWLIKHFDEPTLDHIRNCFDKDGGMEFMHNFNLLSNKISDLQKANVPQDSEAAQSLAKDFWGMVMEFMQGDMSMFPKLMEIGNFNERGNESEQKQALINGYIGKSLDVYFAKSGVNPFEEGSK